MTKTLKTLTLLTTVLLLSSFTRTKVNQFIGTYGVSANDPSHIQLTIRPDQTFYYQDFSIADRHIVAKGSWKLKGNKLVLTDSTAEHTFHHVWTFEKNGQVAKSRKGLAFYRLSKVDE